MDVVGTTQSIGLLAPLCIRHLATSPLMLLLCSIALRVTLPSSKPNADPERPPNVHRQTFSTYLWELLTQHTTIHTCAGWPTIIIVDSISFHTDGSACAP